MNCSDLRSFSINASHDLSPVYSLLIYTLHHRVVEYDIVQSLQLFLQTDELARYVADAHY